MESLEHNFSNSLNSRVLKIKSQAQSEIKNFDSAHEDQEQQNGYDSTDLERKKVNPAQPLFPS